MATIVKKGTKRVSQMFEKADLAPYDKEEEMQIGCNCRNESKRGDRQNVGRLQRDLAGSYYWSGNLCKDYWFFICNWHPLLGLCLSHPAHPWNKVERAATLFLSCSLTMIPAALAAHTLEEMDLAGLQFIFVFCIITLPVMVFEVLLYWINICDIFCKGKGCLCDCVANFTTCLQTCCLCASVLFSLIVLVVSAAIAKVVGLSMGVLLMLFVVSRVQNAILWFPLWTFLPCVGFLWGWYFESKAAEDGIDLINQDIDEEEGFDPGLGDESE